MNLTTDQIQGQIATKEAEAAALVKEHNEMLQAFEQQRQAFMQQVAQNQAKANQIDGAITALKALMPKPKGRKKRDT